MNIAIVDSRLPKEQEHRLRCHGFEVMRLPACPTLGEAIASHPDSLMFHLGDEIVTSAEYCDVASYIFSDVREMAPRVRIHFSPDVLGYSFPEDCKFNALVIGGAVFCRAKSISETVMKLAAKRGLEVVDVKQAYPACATLALGDKAAVCADKGMAQALRQRGIRVYEVECGGISLPPYEYGFIGGACGVFGNTIYFFGDYKTHPSADILELMAREQGYTLVSLGEGKLVDLGGILFIKQEA